MRLEKGKCKLCLPCCHLFLPNAEFRSSLSEKSCMHTACCHRVTTEGSVRKASTKPVHGFKDFQPMAMHKFYDFRTKFIQAPITVGSPRGPLRQSRHWFFSMQLVLFILLFFIAKTLSISAHGKHCILLREQTQCKHVITFQYISGPCQLEKIWMFSKSSTEHVTRCWVPHLNTSLDVIEIPTLDEHRGNMLWWQVKRQWDSSS